MPDVELRFSREEYAERLAKTRRAMEAKGVDLLIISDPSNMNWLTGYDGWSFYVHQAVIVPGFGAVRPDGKVALLGRGGSDLTAVFLAWSFLGNAWDRSWLIWPLGALVFAAIAGGIGAWQSRRN